MLTITFVTKKVTVTLVVAKLDPLLLRIASLGQDYIDLAKVIAINIVDFEFLNTEKFHTGLHQMLFNSFPSVKKRILHVTAGLC